MALDLGLRAWGSSQSQSAGIAAKMCLSVLVVYIPWSVEAVGNLSQARKEDISFSLAEQ